MHCHYLGTAFYLQETVLIPSFKNRITRLNGLKLGVSAADQRVPCCTRVVWEYLGREIRRAQHYSQIGLFALDDDRINADIRWRLDQAR